MRTPAAWRFTHKAKDINDGRFLASTGSPVLFFRLLVSDLPVVHSLT